MRGQVTFILESSGLFGNQLKKIEETRLYHKKLTIKKNNDYETL